MRTWYRNLDYLTLFAWIGLVLSGLVAIYSTTHGEAQQFLLDTVGQSFQRQVLWAVISMIGIVIALLLPIRFYQKIAYPAYIFTLLLLVVAMFLGREVNGARSWIYLGPIGFQSSELAKVGTVLAVAQLFSSRRPNSSNVRYGLATVGLLVVPALLIILQNDTGTALVFLALVPIMLFWSGLPLNIVFLLVSPALAGYLTIVYWPAALAFTILFTLGLYWRTKDYRITALAGVFTGGTMVVALFALAKVLKPHQVARIISFTNPEAEEFRSGVGFHLVQSKAAVGSGGLFGKGFMEGTQTQGRYIPGQSTDFVFSVIGEEWGFVGAIFVLALFALFLVRIVTLGEQVKHPFGSMLAAGAAGIFLIHVFINVGMVLGLLPVIGIPLPFISYGGSALLANSAILAIVLNLHMRRDDFSIYGY